MKNKTKNKRGFSLLEVIMALFVLSVGVAGVFTLMASSLANSNNARDMIVASQLAQEGIELVHNQRDTNVISGAAGGPFEGIGVGICSVSIDSNLECLTPSPNLNYEAVSGGILAFTNSGMTATKFSRKIVVGDVPNGKKITSIVSWNEDGAPDAANDCLNINKCIYAEATLTDWGQN